MTPAVHLHPTYQFSAQPHQPMRKSSRDLEISRSAPDPSMKSTLSGHAQVVSRNNRSAYKNSWHAATRACSHQINHEDYQNVKLRIYFLQAWEHTCPEVSGTEGTGCRTPVGLLAAAAAKLGYSLGLSRLSPGGNDGVTGKATSGGCHGALEPSPRRADGVAQFDPAVSAEVCCVAGKGGSSSGFCQEPPPPEGTIWVEGSLPAFSCANKICTIAIHSITQKQPTLQKWEPVYWMAVYLPQRW